MSIYLLVSNLVRIFTLKYIMYAKYNEMLYYGLTDDSIADEAVRSLFKERMEDLDS